jgi:spore germination protein YaaH
MPVAGVRTGVSHNGSDLPPAERLLVHRAVRRPVTAALALATLVALLAGLVIAAPAEADGPGPKRIVAGWLPYWMTTPGSPAGITSAVQNADLMSEVSPFWYSTTAKNGGGVQVRVNPSFSNGQSNIAWAMGQLKAAGLKVVPAIADGSGKGRMAATLADPALRTQHVNDIVALVTSNGFDGIDLDYEGFAFNDGSSSWGATQPNWTAFVTELGAALHGQGKMLTVTIPPPCSTGSVCGPKSGYWVYNIAGIAPAADRIRIMAYDYHVNGIGPIAPMPWVRAIVQYSVSVMDASKLQIGVPTYGRAWTRKSGNSYQLSGTCPAPGSSAYRSLTAMASVTDANIPSTLASAGVDPASVQWSDSDQESWVYYNKKVTWTDSTGTQQTCTAKRVMWWVGPQAVVARAQLVGEFGLAGIAQWTIGGEDPAQWPLVRAYAQSLAPASTDIAATGTPTAVFGTPVPVTATVTSAGAPLAGVPATLQFRRQGTKKWVDVQSAATAADGTVAFQVAPPATGTWQVFVPADGARVEGTSAPFTTQVLAAVTATPLQATAARNATVAVKVKVRPALGGQKVALQIQRPDGTWKNVKDGVVNAKGRVRLAGKAPAAKGRYTYRVVAVGKAGILANASAPFTIKVTKK